MRETANARTVSKASVPYLEMKRRQFRKAACVSLRESAREDQKGNHGPAYQHWQRYEEAARLAHAIDRQIKERTVAGLSLMVARILRAPLLPMGDVA
ncbi:hypothetical protein IGS75_01310 [Gluconobacter sphaericus]|uniref:hypothetical protein n=1 Tax=Gluconobacter sphaericus TaxID=574987 RepID=UPI0019244E46|nr:hypothetical protein [Gluconobacter sphaericus]QQX91308.1 hypothetical protein IGS75_01310 [Gluconobacter sphaericus]